MDLGPVRLRNGSGPRTDEQGDETISATRSFGQPLQGFSGYAAERAADGSLHALIDNGFGSKANSSDALLSFTRIRPDFEAGTITVLDRVWLHDPDMLVPFRIVARGDRDTLSHRGRLSTPKASRIIGDTVWIGEEFGPYLISATLDGRVTGVYPTLVDGAELRSPDHPALRANVRRRNRLAPAGLGGASRALPSLPMAAPSGACSKSRFSTRPARARAISCACSPSTPRRGHGRAKASASRSRPGAVAIGDFNFIDATRALVIERDGGEGHPSAACASGATEGCFRNPARVKRVTLIDTAAVDEDGFVRTRRADRPHGHPRHRRLAEGRETTGEVPDGTFVFPFVTIESVLRDGEEHILVSNDNNLPFSAGRMSGVADDNEVIRLHVPRLLSAE